MMCLHAKHVSLSLDVAPTLLRQLPLPSLGYLALSVGLLLCCKVQELSMFHVLKVGGTRNATNTRKSPTKKKETFCRHATHTHTHTEVVCVGRYQPLSGTFFSIGAHTS